MLQRWRSLEVKFPALMTGIVLLTSAVFLWSAHRQFGDVLMETSGARLSSSGLLLAGLIGDGMPATQNQAATLARIPEVRLALTEGEDSAFVTAALKAVLGARVDSALLQIRLTDNSGRIRYLNQIHPGPKSLGWADSVARTGKLSTTKLSLSPLLDVDRRAQFEVVIPVHARDGGESHIGYLTETRVVRGRGADAVRRLMGTGTMLFGQPNAGVWSDLETVVPGPPAIMPIDTVVRFDDSPRGSGVGVAHSIRGTPWVLWLQLSREQVLAPVNLFVSRMATIVAIVAVIGIWFAWWFSRRITKRIVHLTADVDQVARTASGKPAEANTAHDEIDRLENAFRLMSERTRTQQQLEAQLQQSQKLEAVGRLAGGIAHDFNNVLTVVTNFSEIVQSDLEPNSPAARDIDQILQAANRATRLTRQLLAFSRRQLLQPVRLDLNDVVRSSHLMLERLIPSRVSIVLELDPSVSAVFADPIQIEQVLLNLAVNASDAMPEGGKLTFRTTMAELDELDPSAAPGARKHVSLVVKDTGVGMDRETLTRIFEPFFTTKAIGKGTGLGLATVHGIITQLGGRVWVYSEPGKGTTFKLYLPAVDGAAIPLEGTRTRKQIPRGTGTVLLVEDDAGTREVTRRILVGQGYTVLQSATADHALASLERDRRLVDVVLTDVMMPGMNGVEFARRVRERWPELPLLMMSGYSDAEVVDDAEAAHFEFLEKPFTSTSLLSAVAAAMSGVAVAPTGAPTGVPTGVPAD